MDRRAELDKKIQDSRLVFEFFGQIITTVTWISFCVVVVGILWQALDARALRGGPILVAATLMALFAIGSSALLVFHLYRIAKAINVLFSDRSTKMGRIVWHFGDYPIGAFIIFIGAVAVVLSKQILQVIQ